MKKQYLKKLTAAGMAAIMAFGGKVLPLDGVDYLLTASAAGSVVINEKNFPDRNFRDLLKTSTYDSDLNGVLDASELLVLRNIYADAMGISSLKGIELLPELRGIYCSFNELTELDISQNKLLTGLWCSDNHLTELNMKKNEDLLWVYCFNNQIESLDFTGNPKMAYIECNGNPLGTLDVSPCTELEHLICNDCGLSELDLSVNTDLTHLDAINNDLTTLKISKCTNLKRLDIWENTHLGNVNISMFEGLQYYNCAFNGVTELDVSHNPHLNKLSCGYNSIETLDLSNNPKLVYLDCACNSIDDLDVSSCPNLRFLQAFTNPFTELGIGDCPYLVQTYNEGEKVYEGGVCDGYSWTIDYGEDDSTEGDSKLFLCFDRKVTLDTDPTKPAPEADAEEEPADTKDLVKREELVQKLYEMAGSPSVKGLTTRFTDVTGSKYKNALLWGEAHNICVGYPYKSNNTFGVGKWITRQDAALMLMRFSEAMGFKRSIDFGRSDDYLDYYDIDFDHWEAICWAATYNIMEGKGEPGAPKEEQRIDPLGKATIYDIGYMLQRLLEENNATTDVVTLPGDAGSDGKVDVSDVLLIQQHLAGWPVVINLKNANVDGKNGVTVADVLLIQQMIAGWNVNVVW